MDSIDLLTSQHRALEARMTSALAASGEAQQRALLAAIGDHLAVHLASEEEVFYPAVRALHGVNQGVRSNDIHLGRSDGDGCRFH